MYDIYETFYQLHARPFHLNPDPSFLFYSDKHKRAFDYLCYGIYAGEGLIVVTGDVGTGKTTLVYKLLEKLAEWENIITAHLAATQRKAEYLLPMVATALGLVQESSSTVMLLQRLEKFLMNQAQQGRRVVLIIDEAQNLSTPALERLRLLTNYQFNYIVPLQIFLIGQPEFRNILYSEPLKSLRQRMIASCRLDPLTVEDTGRYIEHRLNVAGWKGDPTFTPEAYVAIHQSTRGVPRRINMLCHRALILGCVEEAHEINEELISRAIQDWHEDVGTDDHDKQYPNNVQILNPQLTVSQKSTATAAGNVQPLNLNFQKDHHAQSVSEVRARPKATMATRDSQQYTFFKKQVLLPALLLLILTSTGVYQFIYHYEAWKPLKSEDVKKAVGDATATSQVIPQEIGTRASNAAKSISAEPAPTKAAPEAPKAAVTEPSIEPSWPVKPVVPVPPATAGGEGQGQPPTAPPAPAAGTPSKAAVVKPVLSPEPYRSLSPATANMQPLTKSPVTSEHSKEKTLKRSAKAIETQTKRPAPSPAQLATDNKRKPAVSNNGQSHSTGWQIKKDE